MVNFTISKSVYHRQIIFEDSLHESSNSAQKFEHVHWHKTAVNELNTSNMPLIVWASFFVVVVLKTQTAKSTSAKKS